MKGEYLFILVDLTLSEMHMHSLGNTTILMVRCNNSFFIAIKQRMEKDIDEVGKIARQAKTKVDELEKDVCSCLTLTI